MFRYSLRLIPILATLALLFAQPSPVWACLCSYANMGTHYKIADVIIVGTVTKTFTLPDNDVEVSLNTDYVLKGNNAKSITVITGNGAGDCGVNFVIGEQYLVYSKQYKGRFETDICYGTRSMAFVIGNMSDYVREYATLPCCIVSASLGILLLIGFRNRRRDQLQQSAKSVDE